VPPTGRPPAIDMLANAGGEWKYRWWSTGTIATTAEASFQVARRAVGGYTRHRQPSLNFVCETARGRPAETAACRTFSSRLSPRWTTYPGARPISALDKNGYQRRGQEPVEHADRIAPAWSQDWEQLVSRAD